MSDIIRLLFQAKLDMGNVKPIIFNQVKDLEKEIKPLKLKVELDTSNIENIKRQLNQLNELLRSGGLNSNTQNPILRDNGAERARVLRQEQMIRRAIVEEEVRNRGRVLTLETQIGNIRNRYNREGVNRESSQFRELENRYRSLISLMEQYRNRRESMSSAERLAVREQIRDLNQLSGEFVRTQQDMTRSVSENAASFRQLGSGMESAGNAILKLTAPLLAASAIGVKSQIEFESAFAGVKKTVDASEEEFKKLEQGIVDMSKVMPQSASDIAKVGEAAGQLGIKNESILSFTETMIKLGDSTNLSSTDAANELARLANITQMPQSEFERLGSTLVELGNNLASTESEISKMALRLAGAGKQIGISEAEILSFAGALSSLGIESEMGGSAFSKLLINLQLAVEKGGEGLTDFAKVAGMTAQEFQNAFREDTSNAIVTFLKGLGDVEKNGKTAIAVLDDLDISEVRLRDTLLRSANASNVFTESLEMGKKAWAENTALSEEASKRYETTESQLKMMKNQLVDVARNIGTNLLPNLVKLAQFVVDVTTAFSKLSPQTQSTIVRIGLLTAGFGGLLRIGGGMVRTFGGIAGVFSVANQAMTTTAGVVNVLGMSFQAASIKLGLLTAGLTVVAGLAVGAIASHAAKQEEQRRELEELVNNFDSTVSNHKTNIKSLSDVKSEYDELNEKLGENRDFTKLTAEEQQKYNDIISQIEQISPRAIKSYDGQGNAVRNYTNAVDRAIDSEKELIELQNKKLIASTSDFAEQTQREYEDAIKKKKELAKELHDLNVAIHNGKILKGEGKYSAQRIEILDDEDIEKMRRRAMEVEAELEIQLSKIDEVSEKYIKNINAHFSRIGEGMSDGLKGSFEDLVIGMFEVSEDKDAGFDVAIKQIDGIKGIYKDLQQKMNDGIEINLDDVISSFEGLKFNMEDARYYSEMLHAEMQITSEIMEDLKEAGFSQADAMDIIAITSENTAEAQGILSQAMRELQSESGISEATLNSLKEMYPQLDGATNISAETIAALANTMVDAQGSMRNSQQAISATVFAEVQNRINMYKAELAAMMEVYGARSNAIKGLASEAARYYSPEHMDKLTKDALMPTGSKALSPVMNMAELEAIKTRKSLNADLSQAQRVMSELNKIKIKDAVNSGGGGGDGGNYVSPSSGSDKKSGGGGKKATEKKEKDIYTPDIDEYYSLEEAINKVSNAITRLKDKEKVTKDEKEKINLQKQQIGLYKEQQQNVHKLAEAKRQERKEAFEYLNSRGFLFDKVDDGTSASDGIKLLNPEHLGTFASNTDEGIAAIKEMEGVFKSFGAVNKDIASAGNDWWGYQNDIVSSGDAIEKTIQDQIDKLKDLQEELSKLDFAGKVKELKTELSNAKFENKIEKIILELESFDKRVDLLKDKLDFIHEDDFKGRIDVVSDAFKASKDRTRQLSNEMDRLRKITPKNKEEADKLASAMQSVQSQMKASHTETLELQRQLDMLRLDNLSKPFKDASRQIELELSVISHNLQMLQSGVLPQDLGLDMLLPIPDFSDAFMDMRSEGEKIYDKQVTLEKNIQDLKKYSLEEQLKESEKYYKDEMNKLVEHYNEMLQKIAEENEKLQKIQEFASPEQRKVIEESNKVIQSEIVKNNEIVKQLVAGNDKLISEDKIKHYAKLIEDLGLKWHNPEKTSMLTHFNSIKNVTNTYLSELQASYTNTWGDIVKTIQNSVATITDSVSKANSAVANMKTPSSSSVASSGSSKSSSSSGKSSSSSSARKVIGTLGQISKLASGTDSHKGGVALTGEEGYEGMITPNNRFTLLGKNGAELVDIPKDSVVIPHEETKEILSYTGNVDGQIIPRYASGIGKSTTKQAKVKAITSIVKTKPTKSSSSSSKSSSRDDDRDYRSSSSNITVNVKTDDDKHRERQNQNYAVSMSSAFKSEYDKYLSSRKSKLKEIEQDQDKILKNLIPEKELEEFKQKLLDKIDEQLGVDIDTQSRLKIDILTQQKSNIEKYVDELKSEYDKAISDGKVDLAKEIYQRYNEEWSNFQKVNQDINNAIKERYDYQFALMEKQINKQKQLQQDLQKDLDYLNNHYSKEYDAKLDAVNKILEAEKKQQSSLAKSRDELEKQLKALKVGSYEWNIVNEQVEELNSRLKDSRNEIANINKEVAQISFDKQLSEIEKQLFDGTTRDEESKKLDDKIKQQEKYLDGLEKELEIIKLKEFIRKNELELTQEQLDLLNSTDKIDKDTFERLKKQLELKQLEQRLENLKNQKTIQQLKKQDDGTWQYEYVVDQDAIDDAYQDLLDKQLEYEKLEQDLENKSAREDIDDKSKYLDELRNKFEQALSGDIEDMQKLKDEIIKLNDELLAGLDIDTDSIMDNLEDILLAYKDYAGTVDKISKEDFNLQTKINTNNLALPEISQAVKDNILSKLSINIPNVMDSIKSMQMLKFKMPDLSNNIVPVTKSESNVEHKYYIDKLVFPEIKTSSDAELLVKSLPAKALQYTRRD